MSQDLDAIFNVKATDILGSNTKKDSLFYSPSAAKGVDKVYTSYIKFINNIHNPSKSLIKKYSTWLKNPETEEAMSVDCPSTLGQPSLLQEAFFGLYNSESAHEKALSKNFARGEVYYMLVYIVKDEHQPANEGKVKIFKFRKQLYDILSESANDTEEENDFTDFFNGKTLKLKITEKSGYNNYQLSSFTNKVNYIVVDGEEMTDTPKNRKKLVAWLKENSPDITEYDYKPWDQKTQQFVVDAIKAIIPNESTVNRILKKSNIKDVDTSAKKKVTKTIIEDEDDEELKPKKKVTSKLLLDDDDDEVPTKKSSKMLIDDDDEDEDNEVELNINDDDDDDDELAELDRQISKKKTTNKKTKKIIDDFDEDEDED